MQDIGLSIFLPLMAIMLAGYLAGFWQLLQQNGSEVLSRFVYYIAMPPFIFISLADVALEEFFNLSFLMALGGGMMAIFCISFVIARFVFPDTLTAHSLHALTAMFSSTAYIGLPIIQVLYGEVGLVPAIVGAVITVTIFMPLSIIIIEIDKGRGKKQIATASLTAVLKNPLLLATVAGLLCSALGFKIPVALAGFCTMLGGAFIPCALFAAGLFISGCSVKGELKEISWLVFAKLILHPLITFWLAFYVFELNEVLATIVVLQAALPSGVPVFILAQHYGSFVTRSSAVIVLSTVLFIPSLLLFFAIFT